MDSISNSDNSSCQVRKPEPDASRIRKNLILKLGVNTDVSTTASQRREPSRGSLLGKVQLSTEPLKGMEEETETINIFTNLVSFFTGASTTKPSSSPLSDDSQHSMPSAALSASDSLVDDAEQSTTTTGSTRRLKFNEEVSVCPIPKREEYSKRIRDHLWNSPEDMMLNCERNSIEFAAEGWDWRKSLEDEQMYRCVATNELIHPVHVEGYLVQ